MSGCRRCDWRPDSELDLAAREQSRSHALAAAHPLCCVCGHSLDRADPQTCPGCLAAVRGHLRAIVALYAELPAHLGHLAGSACDSGTGGADGPVLPGGDVLVLLGPGSTGNGLDRRGLRGPAVDTRDGDPVSVAWTLASWEDDWRHTRRESAAVVGGGPAATVAAAAGYLEIRALWAATSHPAFAEYAADLARLHGQLEQATGRVRAPVHADAACFECGGPLLRRVLDSGLEEAHFTCKWCRLTYNDGQYLQALQATLAKERSAQRVRLAAKVVPVPCRRCGDPVPAPTQPLGRPAWYCSDPCRLGVDRDWRRAQRAGNARNLSELVAR